MISYCHDNSTFCGQILDLLRTRHDAFEIWIDQTHCQGAADLWESIADGMERASMIVSLISNEYFQSKSCRQEFVYATDSLKKRIIPVLIGNFEPKGWLGEYSIHNIYPKYYFLKLLYELGIRMTGMKYIRFRDFHQLDKNKMTELLNTILSSFSSLQPIIHKDPLSSERHIKSSSVSNVTSSMPISLHSLDQQTSTNDDIHTWFADHRISPQLRDLFDFQSTEEMLDYAELLIEDRRKQMNLYAKIFSQKYNGNDMPPHEFNRFANFLERLLEEKRLSSISLKRNSSVPIKSNSCVIV